MNGLGAIGDPPRAAAVAVLLVAAVALHLRAAVPARWAVAAEAALVYAAVAGLGISVGTLGLVVGALLLRSAFRTGLLVAVSAAVIAGVRDGWTPVVADVTISAVLTGLVVYGLGRLTRGVAEVHAARLTLAAAAVDEERLRIAAELEPTLGRGLDAVARAAERPDELADALATARSTLAAARTAAADLRSLSLAPEVAAARGLLASADVAATVAIGHAEPLGPAGALLAAVLREAVTDVVRQGTARHCFIETEERGADLVLRVVGDGVRTAERGGQPFAALAERVRAAGGRFTTGLDPDGRFRVEASVRRLPEAAPPRSGEHRLAVAVLAVVLLGFCAKGLLLMSPRQALWAVPLLAATCALQLHWTRPGVRAWPLLVQAVLSYLPLLWLGRAWGGVAGFLAGALLVVLPARAAWPLAGAVAASLAGIAVAYDQSATVVVNTAVSAVVTGLVVFGLTRVASLADELRAADAGLARAAVVQDRLRAARDLHDLLGHSLAALLLKGELARRLASVDPVRAKTERAEMAALATRARADMATVTGAAPSLDLSAELDSARSVLTAAAITVTVTASDPPVGDTGAALSAVLREAVTNILRHSTATHCTITIGGGVRLVVESDGAPDAVTPPGAGIGNLRTRLALLGGTLDARPLGDGRFRVTALVPDQHGPGVAG
ncbi:sensor histidine kinase [Actinomadura atramentaria]|uniref:sensor histidine kinase n=1 Tax=Actinomadura atramentaria TaxID=1990 RepID=UPI00036FF03A|nr:histidine kinase [Actinomadura atramentaria]